MVSSSLGDKLGGRGEWGTSTAAKGWSAPRISRVTPLHPHKPLCRWAPAQPRGMWLWQSVKRAEEQWQGPVWFYHPKFTLIAPQRGVLIYNYLLRAVSMFINPWIWVTVSSCSYWGFPTGSGLHCACGGEGDTSFHLHNPSFSPFLDILSYREVSFSRTGFISISVCIAPTTIELWSPPGLLQYHSTTTEVAIAPSIKGPSVQV